MISAYLTLITGLSIDELTTEPSLVVRRVVIVNTLLFALGFTIIFTLVGGVAGSLGQLLRDSSRFLEVVGGLVIVTLGL